VKQEAQPAALAVYFFECMEAKLCYFTKALIKARVLPCQAVYYTRGKPGINTKEILSLYHFTNIL
jgi:hypothetical protein